MDKKLSEKDQILELLTKTELTSSKIHELMGINKQHVYIYLNSLLKDKRIERLNDKKPYIYFAVKTKEYLAFLNDFFKDNIEYLMKDPKIDKFIEKNEKTFNKIEMVITNA